MTNHHAVYNQFRSVWGAAPKPHVAKAPAKPGFSLKKAPVSSSATSSMPRERPTPRRRRTASRRSRPTSRRRAGTRSRGRRSTSSRGCSPRTRRSGSAARRAGRLASSTTRGSTAPSGRRSRRSAGASAGRSDFDLRPPCAYTPSRSFNKKLSVRA